MKPRNPNAKPRLTEGQKRSRVFMRHMKRIYEDILDADLTDQEVLKLYKATILGSVDYVMRLPKQVPSRSLVRSGSQEKIRHLTLTGIGKWVIREGVPRAKRVTDPVTGKVSMVPDPNAPPYEPRPQLKLSSLVQREVEEFLLRGVDSGVLSFDRAWKPSPPPSDAAVGSDSDVGLDLAEPAPRGVRRRRAEVRAESVEELPVEEDPEEELGLDSSELDDDDLELDEDEE